VPSDAVQEVPTAGMPVTLKTAGTAPLASCGLFVTVPAPQTRLTETVAGLWSLKTLWTVNVAAFRVFVIVQLGVPPLLMATLWQADWFAVYPFGTGDSVAVQVAPGLKPVIKNVRGDA
jgi:hypothetical protein